jgi:NADH-quinone oxidoreductase subunit D
MRHLLDVLPGAVLPDPAAESAAPGVPLSPPDDDDLLRPAIEADLFRVGARGSLAGAPAPLAKHLVWTFGPVHRALPFPLQIRVELDGDRLVTVDPEVGFLHQGLEKLFEEETFARGPLVVERLHPLRPIAHQLTWALGVERLFDVADRVPRRTQLWRSIALELLRVAEHLALLATPALAPASKALHKGLHEAARVAGGLLAALQRQPGWAVPFGPPQAPHDDEAARIARELPALSDTVERTRGAWDEQRRLVDHLEGLGRIDRAQALAAGVTGPALRACGVPDDLRAHEPVFAYAELPITPVTAEGGCTRARMRVRLDEAAQSLTWLDKALPLLSSCAPDTRLTDIASDTPPAGRALAALEAPSGELCFVLVSNGMDRPARVRVRAPSSALVCALPDLLQGDRVDDVIPVLLSLGLVGTEIDR